MRAGLDVICLSIHLSSALGRVSSNLHINHPPGREWRILHLVFWPRKKVKRDAAIENCYTPLQREMERTLSDRFVIRRSRSPEVAGVGGGGTHDGGSFYFVCLCVCVPPVFLPFHTLLCAWNYNSKCIIYSFDSSSSCESSLPSYSILTSPSPRQKRLEWLDFPFISEPYCGGSRYPLSFLFFFFFFPWFTWVHFFRSRWGGKKGKKE